MIHPSRIFYICCLHKSAWYHLVTLSCFFRWWRNGSWRIRYQKFINPSFPLLPHFTSAIWSLGKQSCLRKLLLFAFTYWDSWPTDQNSCSWPAHPKQPLKQRDSLLPSGRFRLCCWECPKYEIRELVLTIYINAFWWRLVQGIPTQCRSGDGVLCFLHSTSSSLLSW